MKKILVILMMGLLCSTIVMGQTKKRNTTKKRKAKTERAMTEFEKQQKEEYLLHELIWCEYYYNKGDYESAERYKKSYEEAKNKNYYVKFKNREITKEEKERAKELSHLIHISYTDTMPHTYFYKGGFSVMVHFDYDGKAKKWIDDYDYSLQLRIIRSTSYGKSLRDGNKGINELIDEINEETGYTVRTAKKNEELKGNVGEFLNQHNVEVKTKKTEHQPSALERTKANNDACEKHKEEAYGKYYHSYKANTETEKENVGEFKYTSISTDYGSKYIFSEIDEKGNLLWGFVPEDRKHFRVHDREIMLDYLEKWWESETGANGVMNTQKKRVRNLELLPLNFNTVKTCHLTCILRQKMVIN